MVGVYWLAWWSEDPAYIKYTYETYFTVYGVLVGLELLAAYARQHAYVYATTRAAARLHDDLLFKLTLAPQSYFDTHSAGALLNWFGRDMSQLDSETFYASEYFFLGLVYGALIIVANVVITPWVLLPGAVACVLLWHLVASATVDDDSSTAGSHSAAFTPPTTADAADTARVPVHSFVASEVVMKGTAGVAAEWPAVPSSSAAASACSSLPLPLSYSSTAAAATSSTAPPSSTGDVSCDAFNRQVRYRSRLLSSTAAAITRRLCCTRSRTPYATTAPAAPTVTQLQVEEHGTKVALQEHFTSTIDGAVVLRSFGARAIDRAISSHHSRADAHAEAWNRLLSTTSTQVLKGNLIGSFFYIATVAIIVPLRLQGAGLNAGDAGFVIVNSCFFSYMCVMVLQVGRRCMCHTVVMNGYRY